MDLAVVRSRTSVVYEKRGVILRPMFIRMLFFLLPSFVALPMLLSGKSPVNACAVTGSIFIVPVWSRIRYQRICVCFVASIIEEWSRAELRMCIVCFMMFIREWIFARRKRCLSENLIASSMKIPNRNVCVVRRLSLPWCFNSAECLSLTLLIWRNLRWNGISSGIIVSRRKLRWVWKYWILHKI